MVEEEDLKLGAISLLLEGTLIDELAPLLLEAEILRHTMRAKTVDGQDATHNFLSGTEDQLLVELQEVEPVLCLSGLVVDGLQELPDDIDDLWQGLLVRVVVWRVFEDRPQEQRIPSKPGSGLGQVPI